MKIPFLSRTAPTGPIVAPVAPAVAPAAAKPAATDRLALGGDGLSAEETKLAAAGLLAADYARLKGLAATKGREVAIAAAREGKTGPFSPAYGDPTAMLAAARRIAADPELARLAKDLQPGDVLVQFYPSAVTKLSNGPASHVLICVGKPAEFVEAVGITAADPSHHGVRRGTLGEALATQGGFRLVRPAASIADPAKAQQAVTNAIAFAEGKLGQAYDFSFGMSADKGQYCSGLAYAAYAEGAGLPMPIDKDPERDKRIVALKAITAALDPDDQGALVLAATRKVAVAKGERQVVDFLVHDVMAGCKATRAICATPEARAKAGNMVKQVLSGQGFKQVDALLADPAAPHEGRMKQLLAAFKADTTTLYRESGINGPAAIAAASKVLKAALPHADTLTGMAYGESDPRTLKAAARLDKFDAFKRAHPILGAFLPGRPKPSIVPTTISPTDLALSALPHADYALPK